VEFLTQYIGFKLVCYTNPEMFGWFGEDSDTLKNVHTIEANILMFHRSFLTSLIMKAWITCALDNDCIAPSGHVTNSCYVGHRFDQDALTIVNTYFYGIPKNFPENLPAYSFKTQESYFFDIRRYESMNYFT
jgi:hypothetical protein